MNNTESKWFSIATSNQTHAIEVERINDAIAEVITSTTRSDIGRSTRIP